VQVASEKRNRASLFEIPGPSKCVESCAADARAVAAMNGVPGGL
jgi:hypothetical protein